MNPINRKMPTKEEFVEMCQTMTSLEISEATGASLSSVSRWGQDYNCKPVRRNHGGDRRSGIKAPVRPIVVRDIPMPATRVEGRLHYWVRDPA